MFLSPNLLRWAVARLVLASLAGAVVAVLPASLAAPAHASGNQPSVSKPNRSNKNGKLARTPTTVPKLEISEVARGQIEKHRRSDVDSDTGYAAVFEAMGDAELDALIEKGWRRLHKRDIQPRHGRTTDGRHADVYHVPLGKPVGNIEFYQNGQVTERVPVTILDIVTFRGTRVLLEARPAIAVPQLKIPPQLDEALRHPQASAPAQFHLAHLYRERVMTAWVHVNLRRHLPTAVRAVGYPEATVYEVTLPSTRPVGYVRQGGQTVSTSTVRLVVDPDRTLRRAEPVLPENRLDGDQLPTYDQFRRSSTPQPPGYDSGDEGGD